MPFLALQASLLSYEGALKLPSTAFSAMQLGAGGGHVTWLSMDRPVSPCHLTTPAPSCCKSLLQCRGQAVVNHTTRSRALRVLSLFIPHFQL